MNYIVHPNQDGSFSVIDVSDGHTISTYRGKDAAKEAYTQAIKMDKEEDAI